MSERLLHQSRVRMISKYWWHCCLTLVAMKCQACRFLKDMKLIWYEHMNCNTIWYVLWAWYPNRFNVDLIFSQPMDWLSLASNQIILQVNLKASCCFAAESYVSWAAWDTRNLFSRSICQLWTSCPLVFRRAKRKCPSHIPSTTWMSRVSCLLLDRSFCELQRMLFKPFLLLKLLNHVNPVDVLFLEPGWMDHSSSEQGFGIAGLGQRSGGPVKLRLAKA